MHAYVHRMRVNICIWGGKTLKEKDDDRDRYPSLEDFTRDTGCTALPKKVR